ncbi:DNA segregation ATPase FtsK/SpoIIIE, S-DNA-T family [Bathymodiolus platifrons methanotrophic gill symbiont]|uniref:DNA translocase FtsK n=1 Tax=Bathymodiolus platifrons methanotrophic gill symbiont TaxID=113268 RepID=UPI0011C9623A|nr:DNA translocase FtsK [Bathymodiolus platifrons methanotrophic gill symbiont]TXL01654.1 cell division protein FtsK [Methylococcaceae bacterium HT1]TXL23522.1 cell division protein FtsK [Methylococcaceae bacterium HT2]GFO76465.1 DNA segregation ATPase FtsK/SpoIIIE, S-DNA-T family [Bathymodiolus platifrons methanotrophic gill symbiont]
MAAVMEERSIRGLRETALLGFIVIGLFYLISLISFSHEDAGWSHSGTGMATNNAGGMVGAWLADFSFSFFGVIAFSFPLIIFWQAYLFFSNKTLVAIGSMKYIRWFGLLVTIISASTFCYLHILRCQIELPRNSGGIIGQELGEASIITFGNSGATLLLIAVFFAGLTLYTHISWVKLMEIVGRNTLLLTTLGFREVVLFWGKARTKKEYVYETEQKQINPQEIPAVVSFDKSEPVRPSVNVKKSPVINFAAPPEEVILAQLIAKPVVTKKLQTDLFKDVEPGALPDTELLDLRVIKVRGYSADELEDMSRLVEQSLQDFNVIVEVTGVLPGPVITRFEMQPAAGVKVSRVSGLAKDLARSLSVTSVRIVEVIAGKSVIGLEIPNQEREMVSFRKGLESSKFIKAKSPLSLFLGKDIAGAPVVTDLAKMPHLLVAGTTGSGKSVAINTMIMSMLYKATPDQVRMIMIDPKMLELSVYEGIPHLLTPVVTDMKDAANALRWAVAEMERRYKLMSKVGVRNLAGFNKLVTDAENNGEPIKDPMYSYETELAEGESIPTLESLPNIVIVIDELADMMMIVGKKVEELIARLAQKARAAGIHLILATQRPSVDVLTGLIKANVPSRLSFQVSSRIDSRTVLDQGGAEYLLGNGDMLFMPSGTNIPMRAHGAFVDDHEVHHVVEFLKKTAPTNYLDEITHEYSESGDGSFVAGQEAVDSEMDDLYDQAVAFVTESRKASISSVQRRFKVGYNRAASMIEAMEMAGVVSPAEGSGSRQVLAPAPVKD